MTTETKITFESFKVVIKAVAESANIDDMTNRLAQLLVVAMDIKGSAIFILDQESQQLEVMASFGLSPKYLTKGPLEARKSISEALKGEPVVVSDLREKRSLQYPEEAEKEGIRAVVSVPIIFLKEVIGVIRLYHHAVWNISKQDLDSLRLLAQNVGISLSYTRLRNATHLVVQTINSALPMDSIMDDI